MKAVFSQLESAAKSSNMMTMVATIALALAALMTGCAPSQASSTLSHDDAVIGAEASTESGSTSSVEVSEVAAAPLEIRVIAVQQYENRMPVDESYAPSNDVSLITLIEFEIETCDADLYDGDFTVRATRVGGDYHAEVLPVRSFAKCAGGVAPQKQTIVASTPEIPSVASVTIGEKFAVEILEPSY